MLFETALVPSGTPPQRPLVLSPASVFSSGTHEPLTLQTLKSPRCEGRPRFGGKAL